MHLLARLLKFSLEMPGGGMGSGKQGEKQEVGWEAGSGVESRKLLVPVVQQGKLGSTGFGSMALSLYNIQPSL